MQKEVIEAAREYALNYSKRLPDFICTQVTRRFYDPSGLEIWRSEDTITTKLSYFEQKEDYKVILVNNTPTNIDYQRLGGAISSGEFGTMLRELFERETAARFQWTRWATLRGRRMHVYNFQVDQPNSKYSIQWEREKPIIAGYEGAIFVDAKTTTVQRIEMQATNLPSSYPIQQVSVRLDYDQIDIGGTEYTLPMMSVMRSRAGKALTRNEVEFRAYKKFGAEATISFEPPPLTEDKTTEQPPKP